MHPKGSTQLKIRKWWVPLRSAFYLSFFVRIFKYLSINSARYPTEKTIKDIFHFLEITMIHSSTVTISNVKLKIVLKVYHVLYNDRAGKNTISKVQHTEESRRKLWSLLYYIHMTTYNWSIANVHAFSSCTCIDSYDSKCEDVFAPAYLLGYPIQVTL